MIRRTLGALLLTLLITPLPALCQACVWDTCPDQMAIEEHDHAGMEHDGMNHGGMDHSGMDHSDMDHGAPAPDCHGGAETEPTPKPCETATVQAAGSSCCETMNAPTPVPAIQAKGGGAPATALLELTETAFVTRLSSTSRLAPEAPPPPGVPALYTLLSSLLI